MRRYLNGEALLEGILCLVFSGMMFYLAYSGKYLLFVTPRMKPYLYFTAAVMLLFALSRFLKIGKPKYRQNRTRCLVLALPLMVLLLPYGTLDAGATQAGYSNITAKTDDKAKAEPDAGAAPQETPPQSGDTSAPQQNPGQNNAGQSSGQSTSGSGQDTGQSAGQGASGSGQDTGQSAGQGASGNGPETAVPSGLDEANRTITVSDEEFYRWLTELSHYPEKYEGFTIHLHGTIYRDETLAENEFAVTRLVMSCCAADLAPCGPLCLMDGAAGLEQDKWVDVEGTYHYDKNKGMEITVNGMEDAEPAEEEYVYPFSY